MNINEEILEELYLKAKESFDDGEIPVSAAIFDQENKLICISGNNRQKNCNVLGHAEINCILEAEKKINDWRLDGYYMVVVLEPCEMCSAVIRECRLDKVYYLLEGKTNNSNSLLKKKKKLENYEIYKEKFNDLLTVFFENMR